MECEICGRTDKIINGSRFDYRYLCKKHYEQLRIHGQISESTTDSQRNASEVRINNNNVEIVLKNKRYEVVGVATVDIDKYDAVKDKRWSLNKVGYAVTRINKKLTTLHHFVLGIEDKDGLVVDYIDANKLNNTFENLRIIEKHKNHMNHRGYKNNKSGYTGVILDKKRNKWKAIIHIDKKQKVIGRFQDIEDAIIARLEAELEHYGEEFAPQRHLFDKYKIGVDV